MIGFVSRYLLRKNGETQEISGGINDSRRSNHRDQKRGNDEHGTEMCFLNAAMLPTDYPYLSRPTSLIIDCPMNEI
jgi:hypothetical protein